jgi:hypothetical protein
MKHCAPRDDMFRKALPYTKKVFPAPIIGYTFLRFRCLSSDTPFCYEAEEPRSSDFSTQNPRLWQGTASNSWTFPHPGMTESGRMKLSLAGMLAGTLALGCVLLCAPPGGQGGGVSELFGGRDRARVPVRSTDSLGPALPRIAIETSIPGENSDDSPLTFTDAKTEVEESAAEPPSKSPLAAAGAPASDEPVGGYQRLSPASPQHIEPSPFVQLFGIQSPVTYLPGCLLVHPTFSSVQASPDDLQSFRARRCARRRYSAGQV